MLSQTAAPLTLDQLYEQSIKPLPAADRLRLAARILNDISPQSFIDYSEEWSEEDYADFNKATWTYIDKALAEAENA